MEYKVIGLMSGSSLDGLDIVYTLLEENRGTWKFDIQEAETISYKDDMLASLKNAADLDVPEYLKLNTQYGNFIGEQVNQFISKYGLSHKIHFIASHGHTVFHDPINHTSVQIGDGATIAAVTGLPVISDLRSMDVALGGQGAPIVPIGDKLLFGDFDYWLNLGGIANITVRKGDALVAFDICPANQVLNGLAQQLGKEYDEEGHIARSGTLLADVLGKLNNESYYEQKPPKSLSNVAAIALAFPHLLQTERNTEDLLRTFVEHIAVQVANAIEQFPHGKEKAKMLVTGGGALNNFLAERIQEKAAELKVSTVIPYEQVVQFKEALVMALIGALRWREETNVISSVTGARRDSISGALWMGHSYSGE